MIGDPSGRDSERPLLDVSVIEANIRGIGACVERVFALSGVQVQVVNNAEWMSAMSVVDFLRDVGKEFRVGSMLARDSVKNRMESGGLSFTEFSYQLMQVGGGREGGREVLRM